MKIYFCGSIRGGRQLAAVYADIVGLLKKYGQVISEHIGNDAAIETKDRQLTDMQIHDRDLGWIAESDLIVAEVTVPSLGVGYEIGRSLERGKPVLCLFNPSLSGHLSAMIAGCLDLKVESYSRIEELVPMIDGFISGLKRTSPS